MIRSFCCFSISFSGFPCCGARCLFLPREWWERQQRLRTRCWAALLQHHTSSEPKISRMIQKDERPCSCSQKSVLVFSEERVRALRRACSWSQKSVLVLPEELHSCSQKSEMSCICDLGRVCLCPTKGPIHAFRGACSPQKNAFVLSDGAHSCSQKSVFVTP